MSTPAVTPSVLQPNRSLPPRLRAGDALNWSVNTRLAPGTFVFYVLTGVIANVPTRISIAAPTGTAPNLAGGAVVDPAGLVSFALTSADTAAWQPGSYKWVAFSIDNTGARTELAQGSIRIAPDPMAVTPADPRSYNERLLEAIRAQLAGKALDDVSMYKIGNRELTKIPPKELTEWEGLIEARVRREYRRKQGKSIYRQSPVVFGGR